MFDSAALLSAFIHGLAAGAMAVISAVILRSSLSAHVRAAAVLAGLSIVAWLITESPDLCRAIGPATTSWLIHVACPVSGLFWLLVLTVFNDWRVTPLTLLPAAVLLATGVWMQGADGAVRDALWAGRNLAGAVLALHAGVLILRGWRDDLVEGRRRFRALLLGLACLYVVLLVATGFVHRLDPDGPWLQVTVGQPIGGLIVALLIFSLALLSLQVRPATFGASRRAERVVDARAEAADRLLLERLNAAMRAEAWRREGLTIGDLASDLHVPEHRLRRLINQRLGHRNFAEFLNSFRLEAARRRLADPAEARTTVAAIAYDLGYGSLGPFNRAFRAATGVTPTEWRRKALAEASPDLQEAV